MTNNTIHMLSCSRYHFDQDEAVQLAKAYGILSSPVVSAMSIVFLNGFVKDFTNTWTDKRNGHFFIRGGCAYSEWSSLLRKSTCTHGIDKAEAKEERLRDGV